MSGREVIEQWLFEYSCRHRLIRAIKEIANKHNGVWSKENCSIPSIYVLLAFLKEVVEEQHVSMYEMVVSELTRLYDVSGQLVPFNIYARLIVALRALVLFDMLRKNDKLVLPRLNTYFPRSGFSHENADKEFIEHLNAGQQQFRTIFLRLIADKQQRCEYFRDRYDLEYGPQFITKMKQLLQRFVNAIDGSLPPCAIDRLLGKNFDQELVAELSLACSPSFELLLDAVNNQDFLTESQVIELLHNLRPRSDGDASCFTTAIIPNVTSVSVDNRSTQPVAVRDSSIAPSAHVRVRSCTYPAPVINRNLECYSCPSVAKRPRVSEVDIFCTNPTTDINKRLFQPSIERQCPSVDSLSDFDTSNLRVAGQSPVSELSRHFLTELVDDVTEGEFGLQAVRTPAHLKFSKNETLSFDKLVEESPISSGESGSVVGRVSLHMTEYLKFIEQTRTVDDSMAQVHTVSSSVPDIEEKHMDTGTNVRMSPRGGHSVAKKSRVETNGKRVIPDSPEMASTSCRVAPTIDDSDNNVVLNGSEESFVSDSDLQSRLDSRETHLVPSSYSFDQYDVVLNGMHGCAVPIPEIEKYLRPAVVRKACIVKLVRNKELERRSLKTGFRLFT